MSEYKKEIKWKSWFAFSKELSELGDDTLRCVDIVIYCYLWDEQDYYINELKRKEYRPSLPAIAKQTRNTEFIVRKSLKKLVGLGLITKLAEATSREGACYQVFDFHDIDGMLDGKSNKEEREEALEQRRVEHEEWKESQQVVEQIIEETTSNIEIIEQFYSEPIIQNKSDDLIISELNALADELGYDWNVEGLLDLYKLSGIESCKNQMKDRMSLDAANDNQDWSSKYSNHSPVIEQPHESKRFSVNTEYSYKFS